MFWIVKAQICLSIYNTLEIICNSNLHLINWCRHNNISVFRFPACSNDSSSVSFSGYSTATGSRLVEYMSNVTCTWSIEKCIELQSWRANVCVKPKFQVRQGASRTFVWYKISIEDFCLILRFCIPSRVSRKLSASECRWGGARVGYKNADKSCSISLNSTRERHQKAWPSSFFVLFPGAKIFRRFAAIL